MYAMIVKLGTNYAQLAGPRRMVSTSQAQQQATQNKPLFAVNQFLATNSSSYQHQYQYHDSNNLVTITGTPESNQIALYLLYSRLELEKNRLGMRQQ